MNVRLLRTGLLLVVIGTASNLGGRSVASMLTEWGWTSLVLNAVALAGAAGWLLYETWKATLDRTT